MAFLGGGGCSVPFTPLKKVNKEVTHAYDSVRIFLCAPLDTDLPGKYVRPINATA